MEQLEVVVHKYALVERLQKNKERFVKSYDALVKAYEKKAEQYQKKYAKFVEKVKAKKVPMDEHGPMPPSKPTDWTKTYEFYIDMIENHIQGMITLTEGDYRKLWNDKWTWTHGHINMLSMYASADANVEEALRSYRE